MSEKIIETTEILSRILSEQSGFAREDFNGGSKLADDLLLDSLDEVEIRMAIEEELDLDLSEASELVDFEKITTVQDLVDLVLKLQA